MKMEEITKEIELPGFRFHPTEEELLDFYLKNVVFGGKRLQFDIIGFLNIYHHEPWDLPGMAKIGEREWYFFVPRDRKQGNGGRANRTTKNGFWKATGSDRKIVSLSEPKRVIGMRKTLVFYRGRAPRGSKTDWIMNEYRLADNYKLPKDIVLCKIYRKATPLKVLEQRAAEEAEIKNVFQYANSSPLSSSSPVDTISFCSQQEEDVILSAINENPKLFKKEQVEEEELRTTVEERLISDNKEADETSQLGSSKSLQLPLEMDKLMMELQVPKSNMDWTQDSFWTQFTSPCPWLHCFTPYANILYI